MPSNPSTHSESNSLEDKKHTDGDASKATHELHRHEQQPILESASPTDHNDMPSSESSSSSINASNSTVTSNATLPTPVVYTITDSNYTLLHQDTWLVSMLVFNLEDRIGQRMSLSNLSTIPTN
jgi:hypothetical protein